MQLGAGWKKKDKNGKAYLSIILNIPLLGDLSLLVYANENKTNDKSPDYIVNWYPAKPDTAKGVAVEVEEEVPF